MDSFYAQQDDRVRLVCKSSWSDIRREATVLLKQSGLVSLESAAALVAEAEFRDLVPAEDDFPLHVWARLRQAGSRLAWMPPRRLDVERDIPMRQLSEDGTGGCSFLEPKKQRLIADASSAELVPVPDEAPNALAAFLALGGEAEAWRGLSKVPIVPSHGVVREVVAKFGPLTTRPDRPTPTAVLINGDEAVKLLLSHAINGGFHGYGAGAAHGRWGAWQTISFLVAAEAQAGFAEVSSSAERSAWMHFSDRTPWFADGFWTGCLACIDPSQMKVSAVAWTASD
jgi:hypothetical protein